MKDSGIEWIGEIPEGWSIARGKHILSLLQRAVFSTDGVVTCFRDGEVTLRSNRREDGFTISLKEIGYQGIEVGDLVVHGMDGFAGAIGISDSRGKASPVLVVLDSSQDKKYLMYYLRTMAYNDVFLALSTGIRVRSCDLKWNKLADLLYLVPPVVEQHKVAAFLDTKCSDIDTMLSKTRSSIEEYKKLKQAVITQAVTKGVRGKREMKDSGVEWIGKIPKEWDIRKLKAVSERINVGVVIRPSEYFDDNGTVPFLRGINVKEYMISSENMVYISQASNQALYKSQVHEGDILIVRDGNIGASCVVPSCYNGANVVSMVIITPTNNCDSRFLCYSLNSEVGKTQFTLTKIGSALTHTSVSAVSDILSPVPSRDEQKEIADYLDAKCAEIDKLIAKKELLVKELESYKKSLIYEVVTGKREV